jgi:hypothetical protein
MPSCESRLPSRLSPFISDASIPSNPRSHPRYSLFPQSRYLTLCFNHVRQSEFCRVRLSGATCCMDHSLPEALISQFVESKRPRSGYRGYSQASDCRRRENAVTVLEAHRIYTLKVRSSQPRGFVDVSPYGFSVSQRRLNCTVSPNHHLSLPELPEPAVTTHLTHHMRQFPSGWNGTKTVS